MSRFAFSGRCLTRREVLASFLGWPVVLAGCSASVPPLPAGEIVGASDGFGHRLRDGERFTPTADRWEHCAVVIVGGGIAGLGASWRFRKADFQDFVLLELETAPGGTSRSGTSLAGAIPHPWAHLHSRAAGGESSAHRAARRDGRSRRPRRGRPTGGRRTVLVPRSP